MKRQAATLAILGATLCGALPILVKGNVLFFQPNFSINSSALVFSNHTYAS